MSELVRQHALAEFIRKRGAADGDGATVVVRVQSERDFVNVRGRYEDPDFRGVVQTLLEQPLPAAANTVSCGAHDVYWLGPDEWLIASAPNSGIATALSGRVAAANGQNGGLLQLNITGAPGAELLAKGCTVDLTRDAFPPGACAQTGLAKAAVLIGRPNTEESYSLIVRRSFAEYVALWLDHAGVEFGIDFVVD